MAVSIFYQIGFYILIGYSLGVITTIKWWAPPENDIKIETKFGKLVIRGRNNTVSDAIDVTDIADVAGVVPDKKQTRKERRVARRANRKLKKEKDATGNV